MFLQMGLDMTADMTGDEETSNGVSSRPSVVIVGPSNVGKRSILSRTAPFLEQEKWHFGYSINEGFVWLLLAVVLRLLFQFHMILFFPKLPTLFSHIAR